MQAPIQIVLVLVTPSSVPLPRYCVASLKCLKELLTGWETSLRSERLQVIMKRTYSLFRSLWVHGREGGLAERRTSGSKVSFV